VLTRKIKIDHPVETDCIDGNRVEIIVELGRCAPRKSNDFCARNSLADGCNDPTDWRNTPLPKLARWEHTRPGVEDLHSVYPGFELPDEITGRCIDQLVDQPGKILRMVIGEQACRRLIGRAAARDHVGGNGPGRPTKAKQRNLFRQVLPDPPNGLVNRRQGIVIDPGAELRQSSRLTQRFEPWTLTLFKTNTLTKRVRYHQNIGEQDRGIKTEAADRLQRYFRCKLWVEAKIEKSAGFFANSPIFRQIASGLTHQPNWRRSAGLTCQRAEQRFNHRTVRHILILTQTNLKRICCSS
jgi:hypothetical protein